MVTTSPWPSIHAERKALAADLASLTDDQWATPSLCGGWSVRQVLAHLTATATMTPASFLARFAASGLRFNAMSARAAAAELGATPAETLTRFTDQLDSTSHPPGPAESMLGEVVVHSEDIRRPLGIDHVHSAEALARVAAFYERTNLLIGTKRRIAGLALRATDQDWSLGSGPEVRGPMMSLVLMMAGRRCALADLSGDGVAILHGRR